jgi:hypothetical protein
MGYSVSGAITQAVYMGVGAAGAMTNVSTYVDLDAGISYDYGRDSEFDDTNPGTFSFTLDNPDGRFTPENTASAYATTVTEGMQVCWQAGARLVAGSIIGIQPAFPGDDAAWAQVVITCDDMLGDLARRQLADSLAVELTRGAGVYASWTFGDDAGSTVALETSGNGQPQMETPAGQAFAMPTFGVAGIDGVEGTQARFVGDGTAASYDFGTSAGFRTISYPANSIGAWGFWFTPLDVSNPATYLDLDIDFGVGTFRWSTSGSVAAPQLNGHVGSDFFGAQLATMVAGVPIYVAAVVTHTTTHYNVDFYIDGVLVDSNDALVAVLPTNATKTPTAVTISHQDSGSAAQPFVISHMSHTAELVHGELLATLTEASQAEAIVATVDGATINNSSDLSLAPLAESTFDGSALDALNDVVRTEQGYLYSATTGTVSSPTTTIVFRERVRPIAVTESFDAEDESSGAPSVIRDVTNLLRSVVVNGPAISLAVSDQSLAARSTSTGSDSVLFAGETDLRAWGEDRLIRGGNTQLRVQTFTVDTFTTPTDRSADILALVPGDRVEITDLPSTVLGFSTWEGWLLGAHEEHGNGRHLFELRLQPVLDDPSVFDTARFMSDGEITLNAGINAAVTSIVYATTGSEMEATAVPYVIVVDSEQMNVTAVNTGTNTLTVTRGYNSTTAATHSAAAPIELVDEALFAF